MVLFDGRVGVFPLSRAFDLTRRRRRRPQEIDFPTLATMTEDDLKGCVSSSCSPGKPPEAHLHRRRVGITLFGPRRKIVTALQHYHECRAANEQRRREATLAAAAADGAPPAVGLPSPITCFRR